MNASTSAMPSDLKGKLSRLIEYGKDTFPTACAAYRILLTLAFSVASCERSFSKLKLIKTYLRSTMAQERVSNLAILSIEWESLTPEVKKEAVEKFVQGKARLGFRH
jgi:hypothetical protein